MRGLTFLVLALAMLVVANVPGGGTTGVDVKVVDNGTTVVLDNGVVAVTVTKASATVTSFTYGGGNILAGGNSGGQFYWSWNMPNYQNPAGCAYTLVSDPKTDSGDRAEILLHMKWSGDTATAAMDVDVRYALLRGSSGLYAAAKLSHPANYPDNPGGEWRMAGYVGSAFDWLSVDSLRNQKMCAPADWDAGTQPWGAPKEVHLLHQGIYAGKFECKYSYAADLGRVDAWGWSSTANKTGIWMTVPSHEYYQGGPLKRELMCHTGPTLLNMLGGQHYGTGSAFDMPAGQEFHKLYGPFLIYANKTSASTNAANVLWQDALAQAKAEQSAWPYDWFKESTYLHAADRGSVSGSVTIDDWGNPGASPADLWVGLAPGGTDFQQQTKTYQFWTKTDATGSFELKNVIPGTYTLYAFGRGANVQFAQAGVTVKAGQNPSIHAVWVPERKGATAWEIGYPDRTAEKFKHDTDYFRWGIFQEFPTDFPKGLTYTVGKSDWRKDWNFAQPTLSDTDATGATVYHQYPWTVDFDLASAPLSGATDSASLYFSFASTFSAALIVSVNGTNVTTPATGFFPANPSDAMVRLGSHGAWSEARVTFPAKLLKAGANSILLNQRKAASGASVMYDYLRLELPGKALGVVGKSRLTHLAQRGDRLWGDGIHAVELVRLDGHRMAEAEPGASLSLRETPRGTYVARCGGEAIRLAVP